MKLHSLAVWVAVVMATGGIGAERWAHADGIVLESYTGERPADAPRLLGPVLEELSRKKFNAGDGVARMFESNVSRPSRAERGIPGDFSAQVDRGFKAWVSGNFDESVKILVPLIEGAHANTAEFAVQPGLREPLQKALIALSLAEQRIGDQSAMRGAMTELMRAFPDATISRATYGPDAQTAFEQVRKDVVAAGKGKLTVKVSDEAAIVFIDEAYRAVGSTSADAIPGEYRVVVMMNKAPSRAYRVVVRANEETIVQVDPKFDTTLRTTSYTGFGWASQQERDRHEAEYAARFAQAVRASAVAVVGIDDVRGKQSIVGSLVSLQTGRELRRASIPVEPDPSNDRLAALARFLAGEDPEAGLEVQFAADGKGPQKEHGPLPSTPPWGGWRWVTGVIGVAGLATGAVLVGLDGRCPSNPPAGQPCADVYATATPGFIALGAGVVFTGISIYLFATHKTVPVVQPAAGGGEGATFGFATRW